MNTHVPSLLLLDSSPAYAESLARLIEGMAHVVFADCATLTPDSLRTTLETQPWALILGGYPFPAFSAAQLLAVSQEAPGCPGLIFLSAAAPMSEVVEMMRLGARGFVDQADSERLVMLIEQELKRDTATKTAEVRAVWKAAEARYQSIVDTQTELICRYSTDLRLTFVNRAYSEWHGQTPEKLLGQNITQTLDETVRQLTVAKIQSLTPDNPVMTFTNLCQRFDGSQYWIEWTDQALFDENGQIQEYQKVGRDVTERVQQAQQFHEIKEALEERGQQLDHVLNTMHDAIISMSVRDQRVIYVSASVETIFGHPLSTFLDDPNFFKQVVHADDLEIVQHAMETLNQTGFTELDHRIVWPNGQVRWLHRRAWIDFDSQHQPLRVHDIAQDITERKYAEEAVRQREANFRTLFNTVNDYIFVLDRQGFIQEINHTVLQRLGYSHDELIHQSFLTLYSQDHQPDVTRILGEVLVGKRYDCPLPIQAKSGELIPVETHILQGLWNGAPAFFAVSKDISDLKMSEEKFATAFHANPAIAGLSSVETGVYVEVNHAFCKVLGFTPDEVIGKKSTDLLKLDPDYRMRIIEKLQVQGYVHSEEGLIYKKDGTPIHVMLSAQVLTLHGKQYNFTIAVDITDIKHAEMALKKSEARFRKLLETAPVGIVLADPQGHITLANKKALAVFGYTSAELLDQPIEILGPASKHVLYHQTYEAYVRTPETRPVIEHTETEGCRKDGTIFPVEVELGLLADNGDTTVMSFITDITDRRQSQSTLMHQSSLLQQVSDAIIATDNDLHITAWNRAAEEMYGWTEQEALGQRLDELLKTDWFSEAQTEARISLAEKGQWQGEITQYTKTGEHCYILAAVSLLHNSAGETIGGITVNRDITDRKRQDILRLRISQVLEAVAEGHPLHSVLEKLALAVEEYEGAIKASVLLLDQAEQRLYHTVAPSLPDSYNTAINGVQIGPSVGSCGTAAYEKRLIIVENIQSDPLWLNYRDIAEAHGLRACWSHPILGKDGEVVGTFGLYYDHPRRPNEDELSIIQLAAHIAGVAIRHVRAEAELRASEEKYRSIVEDQTEMVCRYDADLRITFANSAYCRTFELRQEDIIGKTFLDKIPEEEHAIIKAYIASMTAENPFSISIHQSIMPDGSMRWFEWKDRITHDAEGHILDYQGVGRDITEQKRAEDALLESEQRMRLFIEYAPAAMAMLDADMRYLAVSRRWLVDYQLTEEQVIGYSHYDVFPELSERWREIHQRCLAGAVEKSDGDQFLRADGHVEWLRWEIHPWRDSHSKIGGILIFSERITERKHMMEALRQSEEQYRSLVESSDAAISTFDESGRILYANVIAAQQFHLTPEMIIGRTMQELFPPEVAAYQLRSIREVIKTGTGIVHESQSRIRGVVRWYRTSIQPIRDGSGSITAALINATDITRSKAAEIALRQSEAYLRSLIDSQTAFHIRVNRDGNIAYCNARYQKKFGWLAPSLIGFPALNVVLPEDHDRMRAAFRECLEHVGVPTQVEIRKPTEDGQYLWTFWEFIAVDDDEIQCIGFDITKQKQAEESLRQSEKRYRQMFELNGLPKLIINPDTGAIVDANPAAAQFYGYGLPVLKAMSIFDLNLTPQEEIQEKMVKARDSEILSCQFVHRRADGQPLDVEVFTGPLEIDGKTFLFSIVTDIEERQRAKKALQEAYDLMEQRVIERTAELETVKNRLETIFNHSGDGILLLDIHRGIQQANYAFEEMFGVMPDHYFEVSLSSFFDAGETERIETCIRNVISTHQTHHIEAHARRVDGTAFDVEISLACVNHVESDVTNLVGIVRDVTERKQTQQAVAEERNLLRTLIDAVPDFIYVKDINHRIVLNNAAHSRSLKMTNQAEVTGKTDFELFPHDMAAKFYADEKHLFESGQPLINSEERSIGQQGQEIWAQTTKVPLCNLQGDLIGLVGITHDITEMKANAQALQRSEERFRLFVEAAPIATVIADAAGQIVLVNREAERLLGYSRTELINQSVDILVPDVLKPLHVTHRQNYVHESHSRRGSSMELSARRKDGKAFPAEIQLSHIDTQNNPMVMSYIIDITKRKQAEAALKQALEQEKELGELKSRFVSMASHEFRNPLAAILATAETLMAYRDRLSQEQIDDRLDKIRHQVAHMKSILEDVLQLARIQAGRIDYKPAQGDIEALCRDIVEEFDSQIAYQGRIAYTHSTPPIITRYDERLMRQIITNVVHNALKYSLDDKQVQVNLSSDDTHIVLDVKDEGIGIPSSDENRLFEPFHRAANVGTISGTGLGLSITKQAVELHKGTITVDSLLDVGTTVTVVIPKS